MTLKLRPGRLHDHHQGGHDRPAVRGHRCALQLLAQVGAAGGVRLLGVSVSDHEA